MSKFLFSNGAKTTVNGSLAQGGTVLVLAFNTGNLFPSPTEGNFFYGTLYEKDLAGIETRIEVVKVINRVADTLTLERDVETLTGQVGGFSYPSGAGATVYFELRVTAGVMQGLVQTADQILALESKSDTDHTHTELYEPKNANIQAHLVNTTNPHGVTREQVGLGNVNNTSDADKPVSTAQAEAIAAAKSQAISAIPTSLPASDVSAWAKEATKPSYTAAEVGAQPELVSGTNIKTVNGTSLLGSGDIVIGRGTSEPVTAVSALNIDCSLGSYFTKTISESSTFTFSNAPASAAYAFTLELTHTSGTVTWPTSVAWPGSEAPTLSTGKTHLFTFVTDNGGTRWRAVANVNYTN